MAFTQRLLQLADHLDSARVGLEDFDHGYIINACGTTGGAIGELPHAFPFEFSYVKTDAGHYRNVRLKSTSDEGGNAVKIFFRLSDDEYARLFFPCPGGDLPLTASRFQVAVNIRAFVERVQSPGYVG